MEDIMTKSLRMLIELAEQQGLAVFTNAANIVRSEYLGAEKLSHNKLMPCTYQHMHNEYRSHYNYCPFCGMKI